MLAIYCHMQASMRFTHMTTAKSESNLASSNCKLSDVDFLPINKTRYITG